MRLMFPRWSLLLLVIAVGGSECFFNVSSLTGDTRRSNLTCFSSSSELKNISCELCIIEFFYGGSTSNDSSLIRYHCAHQLNSFRRKSRRCTGFSNQTDLGYGVCSPLNYETFDVNVLCICGTDLCNENINQCRQSVVNQQSSLPSPLPSIVPQLNQSINCSQSILNTSTSYWKCPLASLSPFVNQSSCYDSFLQTLVLCEYRAYQPLHFFYPVAYSLENYEYQLDVLLGDLQQRQTNSTVFANETDTTFFTVSTWASAENASFAIERCFCFTDDCNANLTRCLSTLNSSAPAGNSLFFSLPEARTSLFVFQITPVDFQWLSLLFSSPLLLFFQFTSRNKFSSELSSGEERGEQVDLEEKQVFADVSEEEEDNPSIIAGQETLI